MTGDGQGSGWRVGGSVAQHSSLIVLAGPSLALPRVRNVRWGLPLRNNHIRLSSGSGNYGLDGALRTLSGASH